MICVGFRAYWMPLYFVLSLCIFRCLVFGDRYTTYRILTNKAIASHNITSVEVASAIECAIRCLRHVYCNAVSFECQKMKSVGHGICYFKSELGILETYTIVDQSGVCYATQDSLVLFWSGQSASISTPATTTPATTTPVITTPAPTTPVTTTPATTPTTTQPATQIVDIVEGLSNRCTSSSQEDIAVVTREVVYVYDTANDMTISPCKTITNVLSVFSGYSLPAVSTWDAMLTYQRTNIDLFANGQVWRWQSSGNSLNTVYGYPKSFADYINALHSRTPSNAPESPIWAVHRKKTGGEDLYFKRNSGFSFYSNQPPYEDQFQKTTTLENQNGYSLNPWGDLIDDVVAVGYLDNQGEDFVLITSNLSVFYYDLDFVTNSNDPPVTITYKGLLAT